MNKDLIICIDAGSDLIKALLAQRTSEKSFHLIALTRVPSDRGVEQGIVKDIDKVKKALKQVKAEFQPYLGRRQAECYASLSGDHVQCQVISSPNTLVKSGLVTTAEIQNLMDVAGATPVEKNQEIIEVIPKQFVLDGTDGVLRPLNMSCQHLGMEAVLVLAHPNKTANISGCIKQEGFSDPHVIAAGLASASAVMTNDENENSCCVIDIGAGTTDVAVYNRGSLQDLFVLPVGGKLVTEDISRMLRVAPQNAESCKKEFGHTFECMLSDEEDREVFIDQIGQSDATYVMSRTLARVIEARYRYILEMVKKELESLGVDCSMIYTYVLTGGASKINGLSPLAEEVFGAAVRVGVPTFPGEAEGYIATEHFSSCVGMLTRLVASQELQGVTSAKRNAIKKPSVVGKIFKGIRSNFF